MNLCILGATGGTGRHAVEQALQQGHAVTALVRDPQKLGPTRDRLRVVVGSSGDAEALATAVASQDAVISALGAGQSFKSGGLIAGAVPAIVRAMNANGVRRLIFTSAFGVGPTRSQVPLVPRLFITLMLRDIYADKAAGEAELERADLDWTLVHPSALTDGPETGRYRFGEQIALRGFPRISRRDVAHFLLTQVSDGTSIRKRILVSY